MPAIPPAPPWTRDGSPGIRGLRQLGQGWGRAVKAEGETDRLPEREAPLTHVPAPGQRGLPQRKQWAAGPGGTIAQRRKGRPLLLPGREGSSVQPRGEPWDQPGVTGAPAPGPADPQAPALCGCLSATGPW